jgi:aspartate beta-hydroxylase
MDNMETEEQREQRVMERLSKFLDEFFLSSLQKAAVNKFIRDKVANPDDTSVVRLRQWLMKKVNGQIIMPPHVRQRGSPDIIPGLRAQPWWDTAEFPWVAEIEAHHEEIREELLNLRQSRGFQPYRGPTWASEIASPDIGSQSHDAGDWNVFYLFLHGMDFKDNRLKCPRTIELIEQVIPRQYEHAFFSCVNPGTHILPHHGPTNKKLRLHFPILGSSSS